MTDCMLNDLRLARSGDKAASERLALMPMMLARS